MPFAINQDDFTFSSFSSFWRSGDAVSLFGHTKSICSRIAWMYLVFIVSKVILTFQIYTFLLTIIVCIIKLEVNLKWHFIMKRDLCAVCTMPIHLLKVRMNDIFIKFKVLMSINKLKKLLVNFITGYMVLKLKYFIFGR